MAKKNEITPDDTKTLETVDAMRSTENPEAPTALAAPAPIVAQVENGEAAGSEEPKMLSLTALATKHRVPTWQAAALHRYMGWEPGKMVLEADFVAALEGLNSRRLGGGRRG